MQSRSRQSGKTSMATTRRSPRGEARNAPTSSGRRVTCVASPPPIGRYQTCGEPVARRQEIDAASVGSPVRDAVVLLAGRQPARRRVRVELEQPEVGAAAIGREIGLAQRVDDPPSVGRQGGVGEARESNEVRRGQAMRCRRCEQRKCRQGGGQDRSLHRDPPDRREFYQAALAVLGRMNPKTLE